MAVALALKYPELVGALILASGYFYSTARADVAILSGPSLPFIGDILSHTHPLGLARFAVREEPERAMPVHCAARHPHQQRIGISDEARQRRHAEPMPYRDDEGARIDLLDHPVDIPDAIDLYIPQKQRMMHASVRWRHGNRIGVALSSVLRNITVHPAGHAVLSGSISVVS